MSSASTKRRRTLARTSARLAQPASDTIPFALAIALTCAFVALGFILYSPAFQGPFIFDDSGLPLWGLGREDAVGAWMAGVRPALMFSYWLTRTVAGDAAFGYHAVNLAIHLANSVLIALVLWRLLLWSGYGPRQRKILSAFGSIVFLVHPLQTESVSYIAGRSESLAALFVLLAYALFLYRRRPAISWLEALGVLVLFGIAILTKENAICLAGILVLTDLYWPSAFSFDSLRRNWRLYALLVPSALLGAAGVARLLAHAPTAGFSIPEFTPYQYCLTQARAIFTYVRLALAPIGQSVDHDFPASRYLLDRGALFWLLLLVAVVATAIRLRHKFPLSCFGLLFFLVALAPTSSIVPIADPLVERRMYLPLFGLILIGCELSQRLRLPTPMRWTAASAAVLLLGAACYERNQAWGRPTELFMDAASRSTGNARPYLNLTEMLVRERRCELAIPYLERADRLFPQDARIQVAWSWALECLGRPEEALQRLLSARGRDRSPKIYEQIGFLYGEMGRIEEAGQALREAVARYPDAASTHDALAFWLESTGDLPQAEAEYRKSLSLDNHDSNARLGLMRVLSKRDAAR